MGALHQSSRIPNKASSEAQKPNKLGKNKSPAHDAESLYMRDIQLAPLLSAEDEVRLGRLVHEGDQAARAQMIESNLRLVVKLARRYHVPKLGLLDLIEEGNIGLMHAVDKFDPERGFRFSTYASWWIRHEIERSIMNHSRTVRLPVHVVRKLNRFRRLSYSLIQTLQHEPNISELAERGDMSIDDIDRLLNLSLGSASTDAPLGSSSSGTFTLLDTLENDQSEDPVMETQTREVLMLIQAWLEFLDERPREIIQRRFGLSKVGLQRGESQTLEEVAQAVGLTRERVRQIQIQALQKLAAILHRSGFSWDDVRI